jgi:hypothetical protein
MNKFSQIPFTIICKVYTAVFDVMNSTSLFFPLKQTFAVQPGISICAICLPDELNTVTPRPVRYKLPLLCSVC